MFHLLALFFINKVHLRRNGTSHPSLSASPQWFGRPRGALKAGFFRIGQKIRRKMQNKSIIRVSNSQIPPDFESISTATWEFAGASPI